MAGSPDAIVIVGSKVRLDKKVPLEALKKKGEVMCPLFYLNYNADPFNDPWPDTIGSALKAYKGRSKRPATVSADLVSIPSLKAGNKMPIKSVLA